MPTNSRRFARGMRRPSLSARASTRRRVPCSSASTRARRPSSSLRSTPTRRLSTASTSPFAVTLSRRCARRSTSCCRKIEPPSYLPHAKSSTWIARACATGYGEELLRAAFGVDMGVVETAAHLRSARHLCDDLDFLLDIGGQDMKALWVRHGMVTDAALNEACSSGCGAFIEGTAAALKTTSWQFADDALLARHPIDLGTKCTVFMNSRVKHRAESRCADRGHRRRRRVLRRQERPAPHHWRRSRSAARPTRGRPGWNLPLGRRAACLRAAMRRRGRASRAGAPHGSDWQRALRARRGGCGYDGEKRSHQSRRASVSRDSARKGRVHGLRERMRAVDREL